VIQAVNHDVAVRGRRAGTSSNGQRRWYTDLIGEQKVDQVQDGPQSHYTEMDANGVIVPHFHQVSQFQIMSLNDGMKLHGADYPTWSLIFADRTDAPLDFTAGPLGLEALVVSFPRFDS
jgi:hypothetical protein